MSNSELIIRWTLPEEKHLFAFSYSIVESILTCPVYGLIRYYKRKYYPTRRNVPLEAGSQMHEVFAAIRLWQLWRKQDLRKHFEYHGARLFNSKEKPTRFQDAFRRMDDSPRDELLSFCYKIINSGDFYDDPDDRMRTIANMEESTIRYVDEMMARMKPGNRAAAKVWVADVNDPTAPVGIEQTLDVIVEWKGQKIRYIGTIDGLMIQYDFPDAIMVDENKTASRLDEAWREAWKVKSQPTAYLYMAKLLTGMPGTKVRILGIKIKQTRSAEDFDAFIEERSDYQLADWARSLLFCAKIVADYGEQPLDAPQFTHSCNRYFRACTFVDLCAAEPEDREDIYNDSMIEAPLTPSQERAFGIPPAD